MEVVTRSLFVSSLATPPTPTPSLPSTPFSSFSPSFLSGPHPHPGIHSQPLSHPWLPIPNPSAHPRSSSPMPGTPSLSTIPILLWFLVFPLPSPCSVQGPRLFPMTLSPDSGCLSLVFCSPPFPNLVYLLLPSSSVLSWVPLPSTLVPSNLYSSSSSPQPPSFSNHFLPS